MPVLIFFTLNFFTLNFTITNRFDKSKIEIRFSRILTIFLNEIRTLIRINHMGQFLNGYSSTLLFLPPITT